MRHFWGELVPKKRSLAIDTTRDTVVLKTREIIHSENRVEKNFIMGKDDKVQKEKQPSGNPAKETNGASQPTNADAGIHQWFATLQIEERARALGFQDGTMLSILLKRALLASSSLESIAESRTDKIGE